MRTGAPAGLSGYFHEAVFYRSDEEFLSVVLPFLREGVAAGEPTVVALGSATTDLVRSAIGDPGGLVFTAAEARYTRPALAIKAFHELFAEHIAAGAQQVRVVGEVRPPGLDHDWARWARYEAATNHAYASFPVWGMCPYDLRSTPDTAVADIASTHPHVGTLDQRYGGNSRYQSPAQFLAARAAIGADPLQLASRPVVELVDPASATAREATRQAARATELSAVEIDGMVLAVNEAVTNALTHGVPPVRVSAWTAPDRMVVTVSDRGSGPADPLAGLVPPPPTATRGRGLWIIDQLCTDVVLDHDGNGFTMRLVAGAPSPEEGMR